MDILNVPARVLVILAARANGQQMIRGLVLPTRAPCGPGSPGFASRGQQVKVLTDGTAIQLGADLKPSALIAGAVAQETIPGNPSAGKSQSAGAAGSPVLIDAIVEHGTA